MRTSLLAGMAIALLVGGTLTDGQQKVDQNAFTPAFVVELFTSEGCSSCPPADDLLEKLDRQSAARGQHGLLLSFHVDYWDRLGWKDPYSSPAFTERQRQYARVAGSPSVYTPQMIVNGTVGFVGSDRPTAEREIKAAAGREFPARVTLRDLSLSEDGRVLSVEHAVEGAGTASVLNLAVVERALTTQVPRGENAGRTLKHHNVVRAFEIRSGREMAGVSRIALPRNLDAGAASLVAYVQDPANMEIRGAAQTSFPQRTRQQSAPRR